MLCALRCSSLFVVCGVWCVVRRVCDLSNVTSRDWTFHAPAFPGFAIELLKLSVRNNEKVTRGVDLIGRFSLTRVSAKQTEHTGDQYIAAERIGYAGGFRWSHREFSVSRNIIDDHNGSFLPAISRLCNMCT